MKLIKKNFRLGGIQPPPLLLDCPSAILSKKVPFDLTGEPFLENNLVQFFHFRQIHGFLNKELLFLT